MLSALQSLQFAFPWMLGAAVLLPILIVAYLRQQNKKQKLVSSAILFEPLQKKKAQNRKFQPPLRFFLELTALLFLVFAASGPNILEPGQRVALLFDTSFSMKAQSRRAKHLQSRLAQAQESATKLVQDEQENRFSVYSASNRLELLGEELLDAKAALQQINELKTQFVSDAITTSLSELARTGKYDRIVLFTDKEIVINDDRRSSDSSTKIPIKIETVGQTAANYFIREFRFARQGLEQQAPQLAISAGLSGINPATVFAHFSKLRFNRSNNSWERSSLGSISLRLYPDQTAEGTFSVKDSIIEGDVFAAELKSDPQNQTSANLIREDDTAWTLPTENKDQHILLISPLKGQSNLGLDLIPNLKVDYLPPNQYSQIGAGTLEKYSSLIFHRSAPSKPPRKSALLILPPTENVIFPVAAEEQTSSITSWLETHPITAYLKVPLLAQQGSNLFLANSIFSLQPWTQSIINVEKGSILVAGESRGFRFAAVGFELLPFEGVKTPTISILTLNLISWINGSKSSSNVLQTGTAVKFDGQGRTWTIFTPNEKEQNISVPKQNSTTPFVFTKPGPYAIVSNEQRQLNKQDIYAANCFMPEESDTFHRTQAYFLNNFYTEKSLDREQKALWPYFIGAVLILMILELLVSCFKQRTNV